MASFALHGIGVSGGIAIGRAQLVSHAMLEVAHYAIPQAKIEAEVARFATAVHEVQLELEGLHSAMTGGDAPAEFLGVGALDDRRGGAQARGGAGVDREADAHAAEAERVRHAPVEHGPEPFHHANIPRRSVFAYGQYGG